MTDQWMYDRQTDGHTTNGWMEGHTDNQYETIIPCHFHVIKYKKKKNKKKNKQTAFKGLKNKLIK